MKNCMVLSCLLALVGCRSAGHQRASRPALKGMELYSWKPAGQDCHFSLLVGTNRGKSVQEITASQTTVAGVAGLKRKLSRLPKGEQIFWRNMAEEPVPGQIIKDLTNFCNDLGMRLEEL